MKLNIIKYRYVWFVFSGIILTLSLVATLAFAFVPTVNNQFPFVHMTCPHLCGIDFKGGSLMDVTFVLPPASEDLRAHFETEGYSDVRVQSADPGEFLIRTQALTEVQHQGLLDTLTQRFGEVHEKKFDFIGPVVGQELTRKATWAVVATLILILLYITWTFRKVSEPVPSWKYGLITVFTAFHDVAVPIGVFAILGRFYGYQIDSAFIAALLTILGYSINDTIVVFDRTRENLQHASSSESFERVVNRSLNQTIVRSFNTSVTVLLTLLAVLLFGGETTRSFALALAIGVATGTYSSIFIASPLLVTWEKRQGHNKAKK